VLHRYAMVETVLKNILKLSLDSYLVMFCFFKQTISYVRILSPIMLTFGFG